MKQLQFRGCFEIPILDGSVVLHNNMPKDIFSNGVYSAVQEQNDGYRFLGMRRKPRLMLIREWLRTDEETQKGSLEIRISEGIMQIPESLVQYIVLVPKDTIVIAPSLDYNFDIWEKGEFMRHHQSLSETEMMQIMAEMEVSLLRQHYNNPPAQSGRHSRGF